MSEVLAIPGPLPPRRRGSLTRKAARRIPYIFSHSEDRTMRLGLAIPQYGAFADPDQVRQVASAAEAMGFHSLWVGDRILSPDRPRDPYPGGDGTMPEQFRTFLDPLTVLTVAAEATERVRLGSSTLNVLWHAPVMLARTLTTLDIVSRGRLDIGVGLGWSRDEYEAAGVPWQGRGERLEEWLDVAEAIWASENVAHEGKRWAIPAAHIAPTPVQRPRPPLLFGGFSRAAVARVGRRGDGWLAGTAPLPYLDSLWDTALQAAEAADRDPATLRRVLRVNTHLTEERTTSDPRPGHGTVAQVSDYILAAGDAGVDEVFLDLQLTTADSDELLQNAAAIQRRVRA